MGGGIETCDVMWSEREAMVEVRDLTVPFHCNGYWFVWDDRLNKLAGIVLVSRQPVKVFHPTLLAD